jgi:hypothetical protein
VSAFPESGLSASQQPAAAFGQKRSLSRNQLRARNTTKRIRARTSTMAKNAGKGRLFPILDPNTKYTQTSITEDSEPFR